MPFGSFLMGGFESSTHRDKSGRRLDLIASTRHDEFAEQDYARLMELGLRGCRDAVRWHLIEREPFTYDFSTLKNQVNAARTTGIEVTWDYFHYGYPDDLDIFSRFADAPNERAINLQSINREPVQITERRIASTKVVDAQLHAESFQTIE